MHDYFLNDLARTTSRERQREARDHQIGRAARKAREARAAGFATRLRSRFRLGPIIEPVRLALPRAHFVVRRPRPQDADSRGVA